MAEMVVMHDRIGRAHTCGYAITDESNGNISNFGMVTEHEDNVNAESAEGKAIREILPKIADLRSEELTIYNHTTECTPQLEISRLPHDTRESVYQNTELSIKENAEKTSSHNGWYITDAAVKFSMYNYSRFYELPTTDKPPMPTKGDRKNNEYLIFTDASYHPQNNETGVSFIIVGENGGMYCLGQRVEPQIAQRAELLAVSMGVKTMHAIDSECSMRVYTDCETVKKSLNGGLTISEKLQNSLSQIIQEQNGTVHTEVIDRKKNQLADALSRVSRTEERVTIGRLPNLDSTIN